MRIVVCVKQVPSSHQARMDPATNTVIRDARESVINPFDLHALEAAVRIKERLGGEVITVSMGLPATESLLRDTVARGADRAVLLTDRAFAGADTLATSYTLAAGIAGLGNASLILCGKMAVDGDTAQIGPELAETLGIAHITDVCEIVQVSEERLQVRQAAGHGYRLLEAELPALITVTREINLPRLPSLAGIRRAQEAHFTRLGKEELEVDEKRVGHNGSPTRVLRVFSPARAQACMKIEGPAAKQATHICKLIKEVMV